jgi:cell wall-associated NlpC family hydrolase
VLPLYDPHVRGLSYLFRTGFGSPAIHRFGDNHREPRRLTLSLNHVIQSVALPEMHSFDPKSVLKLFDKAGRWIASYTLGCRTVLVAGPRRTFKEQDVVIRHGQWLRVLPRPFDGLIDEDWLKAAQQANTRKASDIIEIALQYLGGRAEYGGADKEDSGPGSDFHDYLGIPWVFADSSEKPTQPEADRFHSLDCSGYLRLVWGFRSHLPNPGPFGTIPLGLREGSDALPRRSYQMARSGPGRLIAPYSNHKPDLESIEIGDIVFFDRRNTGKRGVRGIDHVGMYIGRDEAGLRRYVSSMQSAKGPTFASANDNSTLDGTGTYPARLRAIRRF